ncbi:amino acid ABC transporter ATP-binding protein [Pseudemcibacter aquimaris]|uniref:amino acid ABC transporter ATP-binding protein n=1 Tax=Pseudemcibacter aquimaris TaxID=2857064 RepID=UPI0020132362|nr:amino acid ABC transporter ATP-binding protein [Pseudemcibacter aquimaris]MCC3860773.1 amino acid ABC transporter ATP-binding protein [Pseudemcibacter aquimaris]WDU59591.1 amino acid ABC transporter ATP-binding protein [Pseudemcibacter aquimaris]
MIEIKNLHKSFGDLHVLKGVDLTIKRGEVISILGGSGSGKSTLMRCINGLEVMTSGDITVDGYNVTDKSSLKEARKKCAMVFQQFDLYPHLTVLENITIAPIEVLGVSKQDADINARELLEKVGLSDRANYFPSQLSGGQKQRVGICRALAMKPDYILLDEVTSSLDPEMTAEVLDILKKLAHDGMTMISVTHEIEFAREISDRIIFLDQGVVLKDLPTDDFFSETGGKSEERIARFLSKMGE